jgi:TRAP-type C4-dicarboxylate transport system substrate-binding protein
MLLKTAREVAQYQRKLGRDTEEKQIAELSDKGMKVERNIDKKAWRSAMQPVINQVAGQFGKERVDAILGTK